MKLVKFSLATIIALSTSGFAADTLADAFKEGKVSGVVQAYSWQRDKGTKSSITNFGLDLSYETARFYGFAFKSTMQSSSSPFADDKSDTVYKSDMAGSGTQLSEAYLSYAIGKTTAKVGRMYIATPLVYGSGSRMNKESFEGAVVTNKDITDTTISAVYVQKFQGRTDGKGNFGKFDNKLSWIGDAPKDGAYSLAINNSSISNLNLTLAYLDAKDFLEVAYAEAAFKKGIFGLASQYYFSEQEGKEDTSLYGLKADVTIGQVKIVTAYTKADESEYVVAGLGNGADYAFTGSPILSDSYVKNTEAYKIGIAYSITPNANIGANYVLTDDELKEYSYSSVTANYTFTGALKGLNVAVLYDKQGKDGDDNELRFNANYSF